MKLTWPAPKRIRKIIDASVEKAYLWKPGSYLELMVVGFVTGSIEFLLSFSLSTSVNLRSDHRAEDSNP